jgi:hypothetical protein
LKIENAKKEEECHSCESRNPLIYIMLVIPEASGIHLRLMENAKKAMPLGIKCL